MKVIHARVKFTPSNRRQSKGIPFLALPAKRYFKLEGLVYRKFSTVVCCGWCLIYPKKISQTYMRVNSEAINVSSLDPN
jgi:hypothetical protein